MSSFGIRPLLRKGRKIRTIVVAVWLGCVRGCARYNTVPVDSPPYGPTLELTASCSMYSSFQVGTASCPAGGTFFCWCRSRMLSSQIGEDEHRIGGRGSLRLQLDLRRFHQPHTVFEEDLVAWKRENASLRGTQLKLLVGNGEGAHAANVY